LLNASLDKAKRHMLGGAKIMGLSTIDLLVVGIYAIAIFGLAQWVSRDKSGEPKDSTDYFLASKSLPWWAIGASLIAANISAEQIVGMSGSGYAMGIAIASYEWMAAITLLIVGKYFLPIFLKNEIYTMPQFLEQRYGPSIRTLMAVFWLGLYVFVNLTSILWLGSIAVNQVAGVDQDIALIGLGVFALLYQLKGGLKAVALTDIVQVTLLVLGGLVISGITLSKIGDGGGIWAGFTTLMERAPEKFDMILSKDNPFYKDLPGLSVLIGGMWIMNLSYWGFNQYIIQRALAAKDLKEAQKGIAFAAYLKLLMPVVVVLPGVAAVMLAPDLVKPDQAYPTMMKLLPTGLLGLVFAALIAAIIASTASKINSIATIFTLDIYNQRGVKHDEARLVKVGKISAVGALVLAIASARPLLGSFDQAFQYIQEYTGFFTPGICVIFFLGLFWKKASEAGALAAAMGSFVLSITLKLVWPDLPFMDRVGVVFLMALGLAVFVSLAKPKVVLATLAAAIGAFIVAVLGGVIMPGMSMNDKVWMVGIVAVLTASGFGAVGLMSKGGTANANRIDTREVSYATTSGFNLASVGVIAILIALYAVWW
jgi:solute:Na+ symporter, SSS family